MTIASYDSSERSPMDPWWDDYNLYWKVKDYSGTVRSFHDWEAANDWIEEQSIQPKRRKQ